MERPKQIKSTEAAAAADYSPNLGFFLRGICGQEYTFQEFTFRQSSHWNICHEFPKSWMVMVYNCTVSPLLGKALYLEFLIHPDPSSFEVWARMGHCPPRNNQVS